MENGERIIIIMLLVGAAGAVLGILLAPRKGSETRHKIASKAKSLPKIVGKKNRIGDEEENQEAENLKMKSKDQGTSGTQSPAKPLDKMRYSSEDPVN
jgi:gas vesicle protein